MFRSFGLFSLVCCLVHALLQVLLRHVDPQHQDVNGLGQGVQFTAINSGDVELKPIFKGKVNI